MPYEPTEFVEGGPPGISAAELNKLGTQYAEVWAELRKTDGSSDIQIHGSNLVDGSVPLGKLETMVTTGNIIDVGAQMGGSVLELTRRYALGVSGAKAGILIATAGGGTGLEPDSTRDTGAVIIFGRTPTEAASFFRPTQLGGAVAYSRAVHQAIVPLQNMGPSATGQYMFGLWIYMKDIYIDDGELVVTFGMTRSDQTATLRFYAHYLVWR